MSSRARSTCMDIVGQESLGRDQYRVTISANGKVRQPPELDLGGLSVDNYLRNPVVMWAHDAVGRSPSGGLPIGRTTSLTKTDDGRIVADFEFLADDGFAQRVKNAWDRGFLRAASISWMPMESVPVEGGEWHDTRSELLEWSIVSVPADPDALRESHRLMVDSLILGVGGEGLVPEPDGGDGRTHGGDHQEYLLTRAGYEDLRTALGLLRMAVLGVRRDGWLLEEEPTDPDADALEKDLAEVRASVDSIMRSLEVGGR